MKTQDLIQARRDGEAEMVRQEEADLMDVARDAFEMGDGDDIIMHWMQELGVAAHETGEVDMEDYLAISRYADEFNPNQYDEELLIDLMSNLSQDAVNLLYGE